MIKAWTTIFLYFAVILVDATQAKKRVCVIGAGMAGLAATKLSSDRPDDFETITFEKNSDVGGLWIYTDSTDVDEHGLPVHSSIYKTLRTNLPKEIMAYPDYLQFIGENRSYVSHEYVLEYLRNYTDHFNLRQYIKLNMLVRKVIPQNSNDACETTSWQIETQNLETNQTNVTTCDAVMICNGQYFKPNIPNIPGIETFPGIVLHSHVYRRPQDFAGKTVVVLGASASGTDISVDLSPHAKTIYLSHRHDKIETIFPENIIQVRGVVAANGSEFILQDNTTITADVILYCTGYLHEYAFLDNSSNIFLENNIVRPLYKYLINVEHPSMTFIGLPQFYVKVFFYMQVKYFLSVLSGKTELPSYEMILQDSKSLPPESPKYNIDTAYDSEWDYSKNLTKDAGLEPLPSFYEKILKVHTALRAKSVDYDQYNVEFQDNGEPIFVRRPDA